MPCDKPGVIKVPLSDCCFSCYSDGRDTYNAPIAIVLHEVDHTLDSLNNSIKACCKGQKTEKASCHDSFHYGVGQDGTIMQWVDDANTAWSFDPDNLDTACGICGWSVAIGEGDTVDPNLYTLNIAVSTGFIAQAAGQVGLRDNNYSQAMYNAIVQLVGYLATQYGIAVNDQMIWRHCNELDDFPNCDAYDQFITDVQACIDSPPDTTCCTTLDCVMPAMPTGQKAADLAGWDIDTLFFNSSEVEILVSGLDFVSCFAGGKSGVAFRVDPANINNTITLTFNQPQNNLSLNFEAFDNIDRLSFTVAPTSVSGDLLLAGNVVTSAVVGGSGNINFTGPVNSLAFVYDLTTGVPTQAESVCFTQLQSDEIFAASGNNATPGTTEFLGRDCQWYTLPIGTGTGDVTCDELAATNNVGNINNGAQVILPNCTNGNVDICNLLQTAGLATATPGGNSFALGFDDAANCVLLEMPTDPCTFLETTPPANIPIDFGSSLLGVNAAGDCGLFSPDFCEFLNAFPPTNENPIQPNDRFLMFDIGGVGCHMAPVDICQILDVSTVPMAPYTNGSQFLGLDQNGDCTYLTLDICTLFTEAPPALLPVGAQNLAFGLVDAVCGVFDLATLDICPNLALAAATPGAHDQALPTYLMQPNQAGGTCMVEIDQSDNLANCVGNWQPLALTVNLQNGDVAWRRVAPTFRDAVVADGGTLDPFSTGDGVFKLDASAGNVTVTLDDMPSPTTCDQRMIYVKRMDTVAGNTVTINGNIEGVATSIVLNTPGPRGNFGESTPLFWDGAQWLLL